MDPLRSREMVIETNWMVRHPPGDDRLVCTWRGTRPATRSPRPRAASNTGTARAGAICRTGNCQRPARCASSSGSAPPRGCVGGSNATLFEYSRDGVRELFRGPDPEVTFTALTPDFDDVAVVLGTKPNAPPLLYAIVGKHWLRPLPVSDASMLTELSRASTTSAGSSSVAATTAARTRPTIARSIGSSTACRYPRVARCSARASRPERHTAVAVGVGGACLEIEDGTANPRALAERPI